MKKLCRLGLAVLAGIVFTTPAFAGGTHVGRNAEGVDLRNGGLTNVNINQVDNWSQLVPGSQPLPRVENDRGGPDGGDWAVGGSDGTGSSAPYDVSFYQRFDPIGGPGAMQYIELTGWTKAWAGWWGGENFNWVQEAWIELWLDGNMVWRDGSTNNTNRDQWTFHGVNWMQPVYTQPGQGTGPGVEIRLRAVKGNNEFGTGNLGAIFFDSRFDDMWLWINDSPTAGVVYIPEPASMLVLGTGLVGLAGMIRRKKA